MLVLTALALSVLMASSALLFVYGVNLAWLSVRALRLPAVRPPRPAVVRGLPGQEGEKPSAELPDVVVQLPVYNERYVVERVIDAACRLDWPRDRLLVQVLDDSDPSDGTAEIAARAAARWRRAGVDVQHVRRGGRDGYKAGALAFGLGLTDASLVAVFDADFVPPPDWLRRAYAGLDDPAVAFVQTRWGHTNERHSLFTRLQALMVDFHFMVEQAVRPAAGWFTNFTGSAGLWRRKAIDDAGGWSATTLTEDLDLSYRAQLRGWRAAYLEDVVVPQELPVSVNAYRSQQARWSSGSFQCAFRLLGPVLRGQAGPVTKFEAVVHLFGYAAPVLMLLQVACYPVLVLAFANRPPDGFAWPLAVSLLSLSPAAGFCIAQRRLGRSWWRQLPGCVAWSVVGAGTSLTVAVSLWRAARGRGEFRRTPKFAVDASPGTEPEGWRAKGYFRAQDSFAVVEGLFGALGLVLSYAALSSGRWLLAGYSMLFTAGFFALSVGTFAQASRRPVAFVRGVLALGACGVLMLAVARLPDPFEDSYQHWLIAANLATTGRLADPLFQMQDTWLPAYHLLAGLVLRVFGTWQLAALKDVNVLVGMVILALTYRMAGGGRRGTVAMALLALNPIFLLTSTTAVSEPLLLALLLGSAALFAGKRHLMGGALLCLACLTGTKAWIWTGCLVGAVAALEVLSLRRPAPALLRPVWIVPAVGVALLLQARFGFASHSVARAAVEVSSATSRGSLPAASAARGSQFLFYFGLASLPLAVLAPVGLVVELRRRGLGAPLVRLLYAPSLGYLAIVSGLVWLGVYSGSHRYYYLALPAAAILAAGALERLGAVLTVGAVLAGALVCAVYLPVLVGLAADNRGLASAGRAAATVSGGLVTDSPVAAYWSHKSPAQIYGSEALPPDPQFVTGWLRSHGIGGLVLENIDYYRASSVLPDLVRGQASAPFVYMGDQASFNVEGGKAVHAYRLRPMTRTVADGVAVGLEDGSQPSRGKTATLAKGAVLTMGGQDLAGEGMGIGVPIARYADGWHYPGTAALTDLSTASEVAWRKTYDLDMVGGDRQHGYEFKRSQSVGRVQVTYLVSSGQVKVEVRVLSLAPGMLQMGVLNEQSASFDDYADASGARVGPAFGNWYAVPGSWARLRASALGVEWAQEPAGSGELYAGRELVPPDFDWSGLDYMFGPSFRSVDYIVSIGRSP